MGEGLAWVEGEHSEAGRSTSNSRLISHPFGLNTSVTLDEKQSGRSAELGRCRAFKVARSWHNP